MAINVAAVEALVARQKQINVELAGLKAKAEEFEAAIEALYAQGEPVAQEARRISHELRIELGLIEPGAPAPGI